MYSLHPKHRSVVCMRARLLEGAEKLSGLTHSLVPRGLGTRLGNPLILELGHGPPNIRTGVADISNFGRTLIGICALFVGFIEFPVHVPYLGPGYNVGPPRF